MARKRKDKWFLAFLLTFVCLVVYYGALLTTRDGVLNSFQLTKHGKMDWSKIQKRPPPPPDSMNDKWIVITTINNPTDDVMKLANIPGWKVVVVGDTKSPKYWSYKNCVFLDINAQMALGYKVTKLLKYRSYTRKNIGYLYAIEHGAKIIYETDDDNSPTTGQIEFDQTLNKQYLVYKKTSVGIAVNPYAHFGQSSIWPRGYPLDMISKQPLHLYERCTNRRALVQQGVVNGDPDVDAIFRLTRKDEAVPLDVKFDANAEPVLLPRGLIAPYNTQNTLHHYDAFWGLLIPQTVAFRVCDIWRGYWAQRLMWDINGYLSFFGPNAKQVRNSHSYLDDFIDEQEFYHKATSLVKFLVHWVPTEKLFFHRVLELSQNMANKDFWKQDDVLLTMFWLEDLISVGYLPPKSSDGEANCGAKEEQILPKEQPSSYLRLGKLLKKIT